MDLFKKWRTASSATPGPAISAQDQAQALLAQGHTLEETGRIDLALERYEAALRVAPGFPRAHLNLGNALMAMGRAQEGIAAYERALALDPHYAGAHFNLGNACVQTGRLDDAVRSYEKACELKPDFADAHVALGCVLDDLGRIPQAIESFRRALAIEPRYAQVHGNLGNALKRAGRFEEALQSHRRALELDPSLAQGHNNLGNALKDLGQLDEAEACYRQALALAPSDVDAFSNLLFNHNYSARHPPAQLLAEARAFGDLVARGAQRYTTWKGTPDPTRPLRVGLVSGDLRAHPVAYFLDTIVAALGTEAAGRLQLIAYPTAPCVDDIAERIQGHCHAWRPVPGATDKQLA